MIKKDSEIGFAAGFAIGFAIGLGIAFVFAPQSGRETRDLLKEKATDAGDKLKEMTGDRKKIYTKTWKESKGQARIKPYPEDY
jgi:gas vesicle protein